MFESDEFDQVLSQFDFPEIPRSDIATIDSSKRQPHDANSFKIYDPEPISSNQNNLNSVLKDKNVSQTLSNSGRDETYKKFTLPHKLSPKHNKRKMINSFFDTSCKRKFPGPAGLLTGSLEGGNDDKICQMELLSQDVDFSQNNLRRDMFESPLWNRLVKDAANWHLGSIDNIKTIKQLALSGNVRWRKAQAVMAVVEAVDRSATDPVIVLRDQSASIKCTLHRDAWFAFSSYIVSEYCAFILTRPTVLTTGSAYKKHYLNITLSNIFAIYSSSVLNSDEDKPLPDEYSKIYEEDFTVIKSDKSSTSQSGLNSADNVAIGNDDLLDGLDGSLFLDEIF